MKKALKATLLLVLVCVTVLAVPVLIFPEQIVLLFQKSENVVKIAAPALQYAMAGIMFMPLFIPINMTYQSIRKAGTASFLALLRSGLIFIPVLFAATALWQITGLQIAQPLSDVITGLINIPFLIHFFRTTPNT